MPSRRAAEVQSFIAANVRRERLRHGLTQERLAEAADLDLRFLQRVERGSTNLSIAVLVALADALDVAPGALLRPAKLSPAQRGRPKKVDK
jgi:transcriptional regulator with XRE-family HTH domain